MYKHNYICLYLPDDLASRCLAALCFLLCDRNALTEATDRDRFWHGRQSRGGSLGCRTPSAELAVRGHCKESHRAGHLCIYKANSSMCWNHILNFLCHKNDSRCRSAVWLLCHPVHVHLPLTAIAPSGSHQHKHDVTKRPGGFAPMRLMPTSSTPHSTGGGGGRLWSS